jgi:hypothetical protein
VSVNPMYKILEKSESSLSSQVVELITEEIEARE